LLNWVYEWGQLALRGKFLYFYILTRSKHIIMSKFRRREFIKTGLMAGGAIILSRPLAGSEIFMQRGSAMRKPAEGETPDIATINWSGSEDCIESLLEPFGGIGNFVQKGQTVGILANSPWKQVGYYTQPDVVLALAGLCIKAEAKEIIILKPASLSYWERGILHEKYLSVISGFRYGKDRMEKEIPEGVSLKKAEIFKELEEVDVFISVPVAKHHAGTIFSGNLKGMMGISSSPTNRYMHSPDGEYTYEKEEYLAQCIADLSLIRKPDLCLIDAIECATSNGPAGPGSTVKPGKIIAGQDPLATDVFAANLIGFYQDDVLTFKKAQEHGMGESNLEKLKLLEL